MQAVILAGGLGTRLSEETNIKPKPMVEIGGKPILWHILKIYSYWGINDFIICCGYKGYIIKEYFANYFLHTSDITFHMDQNNRIEIHQKALKDPLLSNFHSYNDKKIQLPNGINLSQDYLAWHKDHIYGNFIHGLGIRSLN